MASGSSSNSSLSPQDQALSIYGHFDYPPSSLGVTLNRYDSLNVTWITSQPNSTSVQLVLSLLSNQRWREGKLKQNFPLASSRLDQPRLYVIRQMTDFGFMMIASRWLVPANGSQLVSLADYDDPVQGGQFSIQYNVPSHVALGFSGYNSTTVFPCCSYFSNDFEVSNDIRRPPVLWTQGAPIPPPPASFTAPAPQTSTASNINPGLATYVPLLSNFSMYYLVVLLCLHCIGML